MNRVVLSDQWLVFTQAVVSLLLAVPLGAIATADETTKRETVTAAPRALDESKLTTAHQPLTTSDIQDIILLTESKPALVRLHIRIDGQPFRKVHEEAWATYLKGLFHQVDRNGDGVLSQEEASRLPPPIMTLPGAREGGPPVNIAFNFKAIDADGDGKATPAEVADYFRHFGGGALHITHARRMVPNSAAVGDALFAKLDKNKDGKLTKEELKEGVAELRKLDTDGDELLTPQEIGPRTMPTTPRVATAQTTEKSPFLLQMPGDTPARLAQRLLAHYASKDDPPGKEKMMDAEMKPDVELIVRLGQRQPNEAIVDVVKPSDLIKKTPDGTLLLTSGPMQFEFRPTDGKPTQPANHKKMLVQLLKDADTNNDGFVDKKEAQARNLFPRSFDLLDHDGDGKLTEKELEDYFERVQDPQARALTCVTALLYSDLSQGLFELLDRDQDGRLSQRELRGLLSAVGDRLSAKNGDEEPAADSRKLIAELRVAQLAIGLHRTTFHASGGEAEPFTPAGMPLLTLDWSADGLGWFRKMDRNGDGDITPREFLGPREEFQKLDLDGDGLISIEEARKAKK